MTRHVFFFGNGTAEGGREMKATLGGKGANLAEMTNLGVPVPPGFTIACPVCIEFLRDGAFPEALRDEVAVHLKRLEEATGRGFGDPANPLLVSVRSGAAVSMPGMMETILNLGLNDVTVNGLARHTGNPRFAYDSYRRFIQMYGDVVLGVPHHSFEQLLSAKRVTSAATHDSELDEESLRNLVEEYKSLVRKVTGEPFPTDPVQQLWGAIEAVWKSWTLKKAIDYRRVNGIVNVGVSMAAELLGMRLVVAGDGPERRRLDEPAHLAGRPLLKVSADRAVERQVLGKVGNSEAAAQIDLRWSVPRLIGDGRGKCDRIALKLDQSVGMKCLASREDMQAAPIGARALELHALLHDLQQVRRVAHLFDQVIGDASHQRKTAIETPVPPCWRGAKSKEATRRSLPSMGARRRRTPRS